MLPGLSLEPRKAQQTLLLPLSRRLVIQWAQLMHFRLIDDQMNAFHVDNRLWMSFPE